MCNRVDWTNVVGNVGIDRSPIESVWIIFDSILPDEETSYWLRAQAYLLHGCVADQSMKEDDLAEVLQLCETLKEEMPDNICVRLVKMMMNMEGPPDKRKDWEQ